MISVIVPVFNEEESLQAFYDRLSLILSKLDKTYEIIFVDDGSTDSSLELLKKIAAKDKFIRIFSFRRNQGKAEALTYGFQKSKGEYVVTLDADLQDKPEEIANMIKKLHEGWDVVTAWRKNRKDAQKMKIISKLWNKILQMVWGLELHDYNAGLKVYRQEAAKNLFLYGGLHRFIPLLAYEQGFSVTELAVDHSPRQFGKSKYGFSKIRDLPDMFTMIFLSKYGRKPLHLFSLIGGIFILIGVVILLYLWGIQLQGHSIGRRPLLFVGFFSVMSGLQILFFGFIADLIINISQTNRLRDLSLYHIKYSTD